QGMVHESIAYSRMTRRRSTFANAASVGPGATNMLTGAAVATTNRLPVLLLPSDTFATRVADPVLQQLELPHDASMSVNDAFKPLSRFFDRVQRPEQLFSAALGAMRVLTDPVETGAVTIALPEDVQAEVIDVPAEFLADREWHIRRPRPDAGLMAEVARQIAGAKNPFIVAGGGVIYSDAAEALRVFVEATGIPVGMSQAGVGSLNWDHPQNMGSVGATGTTAANRLAAEADLIIGIGTRYSDFTAASRTAFRNPNVRFININIASFDAFKHGSALPVVADARESLRELSDVISGYHVSAEYAARAAAEKAEWDAVVDEAFVPRGLELPSQTEIIGAVQQASDPRDVLVCAAGSLPGDLHKLWRVRDDLGYHVEYAFSCMGYEIAAGIGVARADKTRDAIVMVGDGSFLMLNSEIVSAVAEGIKF
ncbi:MAG: thiamine pyrophosphate-binding protein, partial [Aurantimicrobium sp.]